MHDYIALTDDDGSLVYFHHLAISAFGTIREGEKLAGLSWIVTEGGLVVAVREPVAVIAARIAEWPEGRSC